MRIHVLEHAGFEGPAAVTDWAAARGHELDCRRVFAGDPLPDPRQVELLVLMGGPMSVNDEAAYPWLADEKELIRQCLAAGRRMVGICLGAQLIASALGAAVGPNPFKEIGWFPVRLTPDARTADAFRHIPETFESFHWHGETFSLPRGAFGLAVTDGCPNQAFALGELALGLQFHLEVTPASLAELVRDCSGSIGDGPFEQQPEEFLVDAERRCAAANQLLFTMLDDFIGA